MSVGARLRDERKRLGHSQSTFAAMAGVAKNTAINWEKDASSPTAAALIAWGEVGADVLYILTGRSPADRSSNPVSQITDQIAELRRRLVADVEPTEARLSGHANSLNAILRFDAQFLTPELREEVESLLAIVSDPQRLAGFRAADRVQLRGKRREIKADLAGWLDEEGSYRPGETVSNLLATFALDYGVPVKLLAELVDEIGDETDEREAERKRQPRLTAER